MASLDDLAHTLGARLRQHGLLLATAESCTGGLLASVLTDVSGSSHYIAGGVITYSNALKMQLLGVQEATLRTHGAVSEETAREMALGALDRLNVGVALSVTGIAGPDGGTADKPVGLVYIGMAWRDRTSVRNRVLRCQWNGDRVANKRASVQAAIQLALDTLPAHPTLA